jgi:cytochrome c biogenesis protein CcmG/thiol:disulfide interchange protein DsbE
MSRASEAEQPAASEAASSTGLSAAAGRAGRSDWAGVARRAVGIAWRHKVLSGITAAFVVAIIVVSAVTTGSPAPSDSTASGFSVPVTGNPAAAGFTLPALGDSAKQVSLAQYAGKPVIVNFFASWCDPCQRETPLLAAWYKQQGGKVAVLGLDENDSAANAQKFVAAKGVSYPIGFDPNTIAANGYGIDGLPQTFFLNAQHHVVYHWDGAISTAELDKGLGLIKTAS